MGRRSAMFVSIAIVACPAAVRAQSAGQIIERHITALGGKKAIEKIVSTDVAGTVSSDGGRSGAFTQRTARPHLFSVSLSWGDSRWSSGFNGRAAWRDDGPDGLRTLYGPAASRVRAEASYANTRFVLSDKIIQVSLAGRDRVRGRPVHVVIALSPDGAARKLFFDEGSHLLVKDEQQTDDGVEERFFDDYRPVDQVMEPHRIEWRRKDQTLRVAVDRVVHNAPIDKKSFDAPAFWSWSFSQSQAPCRRPTSSARPPQWRARCGSTKRCLT